MDQTLPGDGTLEIHVTAIKANDIMTMYGHYCWHDRCLYISHESNEPSEPQSSDDKR